MFGTKTNLQIANMILLSVSASDVEVLDVENKSDGHEEKMIFLLKDHQV